MLRFCVPLAAVALAFCGCLNDPKTTPTAFKSESHEHSHELDHMMVEDAGHYHAALTAHLSSKDGNELDVFIRAADDLKKSVALPVAKFIATAKTDGGKEHKLEFEPAPMDERKDDPSGKCSHFVAKAGWMQAQDVLTVSATVTIDGKPTQIEWKGFNPKKYAHHED